MIQLKNHSYFIPTSIKIIKGVTKDCLYNLQALNYIHLTKEDSQLLSLFKQKIIFSLEDSLIIYNKYSEYIRSLLLNGILIQVPNKSIPNFKKIKINYLNTNQIDNAIITISKNTVNFLKEILSELENLDCRNIAFIIADNSIKFDVLQNLIIGTAFSSIDIYSTNDCLIQNMNELSPDFINRIRFIYSNSNKAVLGFGVLSKENYKNVELNPSTQSYIESKTNNLYHNKKIVIDANLAINDSKIKFKYFGDIRKNLNKLLSKNNISKNKILICKDCEFRRMCIDDREISINSNGEYFYDTQCNYDPYLGLWIENGKAPNRS